jgi:hypothetical protein
LARLNPLIEIRRSGLRSRVILIGHFATEDSPASFYK